MLIAATAIISSRSAPDLAGRSKEQAPPCGPKRHRPTPRPGDVPPAPRPRRWRSPGANATCKPSPPATPIPAPISPLARPPRRHRRPRPRHRTAAPAADPRRERDGDRAALVARNPWPTGRTSPRSSRSATGSNAKRACPSGPSAPRTCSRARTPTTHAPGSCSAALHAARLVQRRHGTVPARLPGRSNLPRRPPDAGGSAEGRRTPGRRPQRRPSDSRHLRRRGHPCPRQSDEAASRRSRRQRAPRSTARFAVVQIEGRASSYLWPVMCASVGRP